jgi:hypothetical protein
MNNQELKKKKLKTAVLFLVFNRPDNTRQVFEAIRQAKPPRFYIAADGPREDKLGEVEHVEEVRKVSKAVDWPCEVKTLFRKKNLGCKKAVSTAITWFFEHEEQGIILEDDCLPSISFFWFCEDLLNLYKKNKKIFMISGHNKQVQWRVKKQDYFFSFLGGCWGWATWRRAWKYYDPKMTSLDGIIKKKLLQRQMGKKLGLARMKDLLNGKKDNLDGTINSWSYSWGLTRHKFEGISCVPCKNLIQNIGFSENATHTTNPFFKKKIRLHEINFPLKINYDLKCDKKYDLLFLNNYSLLKRLAKKVFRIFSFNG